MVALSLRDAARETGVSKSTIFRALKSGRISAPRTDDGGYAIQPSELFRVYPPRNAVERPASVPMGHDAMAPETAETASLRREVATQSATIAGQEKEIALLRELADEMKAANRTQADAIRVLTDQRPRRGLLEALGLRKAG